MLDFRYYDKYLRKQLKGGRIYFCSQSQFKVTWLQVSGPVVRQSIMAKEHSGAKLLASWLLGSRARQKRARAKDTLQRHVPSDLLPSPLLKVYSNFESIIGLNH
jgi:hypothetical protein